MDINSALAALYWVIVLVKIPALFRDKGNRTLHLLWATMLLLAIANTLKTTMVLSWTNVEFGWKGEAIFASNLAFTFMGLFLVLLLWRLVPEGRQHRAVLIGRTLLICLVLALLYFNGLANVQGFDSMTQAELQDPYTSAYWVAYKGNYAVVLVWLSLYFWKVRNKSESKALKLRTTFGLVGGGLGTIHFLQDVLALLLGLFGIISIEMWRVQNSVSNILVFLGLFFLACAVIVPVTVYSRLTNTSQQFWYYTIFWKLRGLAEDIERLIPPDGLKGDRTSRLETLSPAQIRYRLHKRVVHISDGIRFLSRYVGPEELVDIIPSEESPFSPEGSPGHIPATPEVVAFVIEAGFARHSNGTEVDKWQQPLAMKMPAENYADLLVFLVSVESSRKQARKNLSEFPQAY